MTVAQLAHPEWFAWVVWSLALVAASVGLASWRTRRQRRWLMGVPRDRGARKWTSDVALLVALTAIGVALLGPRIGERLVEMNANGVDLVLLVDVSRSMDARDNPPSRLDRARRGIVEILARLEPNDRVALAVFASRGVLLAPLTPDRAALAELIAAVDTGLIHPASSNLDAGIRAAVTGFESGSERPRVVAVFSDGEDPRNHEQVGISAALAAETRVVSMAFGTEIGSAIPAADVPMRDRTGRVVVSRRKTNRLARLADATRGTTFVADAWGVFDFDAATQQIRSEAGAVAGTRVERRVAAVRVAPFAALALALLLAEGLPRVRAAPMRNRGRTAAAGLLATSLLMGTAPSETPEIPPDPAGGVAVAAGRDEMPPPEAFEAWLREHPRDARTLYALGHARLLHGRAEQASAAFAAAASYTREPHLAALCHYALGVSQLERGELVRARDAFFDALAFDPDDDRARFNLEWALLALQEKPPGPSPDPPPEAEPKHSTATSTDDPDREQNESDLEPPSDPQQPAARRPNPLSDAQRQRSLARVRDDLGPSLRAATRSGEPNQQDPAPKGPFW